jgi:hypothetical protein
MNAVSLENQFLIAISGFIINNFCKKTSLFTGEIITE